MKCIILYTTLAVCLLCNVTSSAQSHDYRRDVDSLVKADNVDLGDTVLLSALRMICFGSSSVDSTMKYAELELELAERLGNRYHQLKALSSLQWCSYMSGDYYGALDYCYKTLALADSVDNKCDMAYTYKMMGNVFSIMLNTSKADEYYHKALDRYTQLGDNKAMATTLVNIADSHIDNGMYEEAFEYCRRAMEVGGAVDDKDIASTIMSTYGVALLNKYIVERVVDHSDSLLVLSIDMLQKSYDIAKKTDNVEVELQSGSSLASALLRYAVDGRHSEGTKSQLLRSCRYLLEEQYTTIDIYEFDVYRMEVDIVWAEYLLACGKDAEAKAFADSLYKVYSNDVDQYGDKMGELYDVYTKIFSRLNRTKDVERCASLASYWRFKKRNNDYAVTVAQSVTQAKYEEEMRKKEMVAREHEIRLESENRFNATVSISAVIVLILVSALAVHIWRSNRRRQRDNVLLDQKNAQLELQKSEIQQQRDIIKEVNNEMTDSINYASNIQKAAMPTDDYLSQILGDHLLLYRPLKIVSGDFYWATMADGLKMVVVADCTGHGVPGAFVSMLGISILNDIAQHVDRNSVTAADILNQLRSRFKKLLKQNGNETDNRDGMDMSLLLIDSEQHLLHYAGAFRPMFLIRDGQLNKVEADRMPIGSHLLDSVPFTDKVVPYADGDKVYLFSDGITDQFGFDENDNRKKFSAKRFGSLLLDICDKPFSEQKSILESTIDNWRRVYDISRHPEEQTDDTIVLGIRL